MGMFELKEPVYEQLNKVIELLEKIEANTRIK